MIPLNGTKRETLPVCLKDHSKKENAKGIGGRLAAAGLREAAGDREQKYP